MKVVHTREEMRRILSDWHRMEVTGFSICSEKKSNKTEEKETSGPSEREFEKLLAHKQSHKQDTREEDLPVLNG